MQREKVVVDDSLGCSCCRNPKPFPHVPRPFAFLPDSLSHPALPYACVAVPLTGVPDFGMLKLPFLFIPADALPPSVGSCAYSSCRSPAPTCGCVCDMPPAPPPPPPTIDAPELFTPPAELPPKV